jgi:hypothetical protein
MKRSYTNKKKFVGNLKERDNLEAVESDGCTTLK